MGICMSREQADLTERNHYLAKKINRLEAFSGQVSAVMLRLPGNLAEFAKANPEPGRDLYQLQDGHFNPAGAERIARSLDEFFNWRRQNPTPPSA